MIPKERAALHFWNAASFYRRAPYRDRSNAITVLQHVSDTGTGIVRERARELLRTIHGTGSSEEPTRED